MKLPDRCPLKAIILLRSKPVKFAIVGGLGTITNLLIFFIFVDKFHYEKNLIAIIAFFIAVSQNYFLNHKWTFYFKNQKAKINFKDYIKFVSVSIVGLVVNLVVLNIILYFFDLKYKVIAQAIGIFAGFIINYLGSVHFVFKNKKDFNL